MNKQIKIIGTILGVVLFIALVAGLTYAYTVWQSDNINNLVSSKCFNVLYEGETDLSGPIVPSVDYTGGISVTVKMDIDSSCDINAKGKIYLTTDESTSSNLYTEGLLNYQVLKNGFVTNIKGSITSSGDTVIDVGFLNHNSSATTTYTIYVWLNGEYVTNEHATSSYSGSVKSEVVQTTEEPTSDDEILNATPLTDFVYVLGNETPVVNTLTLDGVEVTFPSIELDPNEVLLVDYVGASVDVYIPDTYTVNDTTYNVIVLSRAFSPAYCSNSYCSDGYNYGAFYGNDYIESVLFGYNVKFLYGEYDREAIDYGFDPSYIIVNSVRYLFYNCTNLNSVYIIPSSVTDMYNTFCGCTSLQKAPEIPSSVTNIGSAFYNCTNLTGTVKINSSNVSGVTHIFTNTSKDITVEVPAGSTTYTKISALTTSNGMPSNVTLVTY